MTNCFYILNTKSYHGDIRRTGASHNENRQDSKLQFTKRVNLKCYYKREKLVIIWGDEYVN